MHLGTNNHGHKLQAITHMNEKTQNLKAQRKKLMMHFMIQGLKTIDIGCKLLTRMNEKTQNS